ncbi:MAG: glycosyltransferase, partial [Patescibacteria group bacterium]
NKKSEEVESLNLNLNKKSEEVESLNLNLNKKSAEVESLNRSFELKNRELLFVTTSLSWRIINFIKKIIKIIIPDSSLGNKIALSVFRFFRKIFRNCIKYFLIILNLSLLIKAFLFSVAEGKIKYKSVPNLFKQTVWNIFNNGLAQTIIIIKEFNKKNNETDRYNNNYYRWIRGIEAPFIKNLKKQKERLISGFEYKPKISILVPVYNSDEIFFRKAVFSVINQWYQNWELCIVDDKSKNLSMKIILDELRDRKDDRIKIDVRETNGGISKATNQAAKMASGDFLAFLDHDDELEPQALLLFVLELQKNKNIDISYSDSDKIDTNGYRYNPEFKPDWSPELLLSVAYTSHFRIIRKELFNLVGGLRKEFDGSQDYDLMLRITEKTDKVLHIPWVLYHWRAVKGSLALSAEAKPFAQKAGLRALQEALERRKIPGRAVIKKGVGTSGLFKIEFDQNLIKDKISIIIPTKDALPVLKKCITSIKKLTSYPNYEIVVINNNSEKEETLKYLESADIKVLNIPTKRFNFSYINNKAVEMVDSEYVVFLNNDTEIINPKWLLELIGTMKIRDSIGAVGGKLLYQDNTVQQAGNIIDLDHKLVAYYVQDNNKKYIYSDLLCNYSAVGAACMIVKKSFFQKIGGFNEIELPASYDDVDLCIRFLLANHVCVYNPEVLLYHHESFTRKTGYIAAENNYIINNYKKYFPSGDPYFNRHFETFNNDFTLKEK